MSIPLNISLNFDYLPLLVVMGLAWVIPMVLSILQFKKIPTVIVEIFLGYIAGRLFLLKINPENLNILEFLVLTGFNNYCWRKQQGSPAGKKIEYTRETIGYC